MQVFYLGGLVFLFQISGRELQFAAATLHLVGGVNPALGIGVLNPEFGICDQTLDSGLGLIHPD